MRNKKSRSRAARNPMVWDSYGNDQNEMEAEKVRNKERKAAVADWQERYSRSNSGKRSSGSDRYNSAKEMAGNARYISGSQNMAAFVTSKDPEANTADEGRRTMTPSCISSHENVKADSPNRKRSAAPSPQQISPEQPQRTHKRWGKNEEEQSHPPKQHRIEGEETNREISAKRRAMQHPQRKHKKWKANEEEESNPSQQHRIKQEDARPGVIHSHNGIKPVEFDSDDIMCEETLDILLDIDKFVEKIKRLSNNRYETSEDLERLRKTCCTTVRGSFQSMRKKHDAPFLENFLELGGIPRLLFYLKHNEDDLESINFVRDILLHCLDGRRPKLTKAKHEKSDESNRVAGDRDNQRMISPQRIANDSATMIVKRKGIELFLRANDRCVRMLKATPIHPDQRRNSMIGADSIVHTKAMTTWDRHQDHVWEQTKIVGAIVGIWNVLFLIFSRSKVYNSVSSTTLCCLFNAALTTLELVGNVTSCIEKDGTSIEKNASDAMSTIFATLEQIVKHSSIKTNESFSKNQKGILKKCVDILQGYRRGHDQRYRHEVWISGEDFFRAFFKKFQFRVSNTNLEWFWHESISAFYVRLLQEFPVGKHIISTLKFLEWISSTKWVTKSSLLQDHGIATALSGVLESKQAGIEGKKRARNLLKSFL